MAMKCDDDGKLNELPAQPRRSGEQRANLFQGNTPSGLQWYVRSEDVISRMIFACIRGALEPVHKAVITDINNLTHALAEENHGTGQIG